MNCESIGFEEDSKGWYCVCIGLYIPDECELEECVGPRRCPYTSFYRVAGDEEDVPDLSKIQQIEAPKSILDEVLIEKDKPLLELFKKSF